jgi:hypothetical protein
MSRQAIMADRKTGLATIVTLHLVAALSAAAAPIYTFTTIDVPGLTKPVATDINNVGQITGYGTSTTGVTTGFLDNAGVFTTVFVPGSTGTQANGLNDSGQIVGTYTDSTGSHGFELSGGVYTTIDSATGNPGTTMLVGINNSGQIAGNVGIPDPVFGASVEGFVDTSGVFGYFSSGIGSFLFLTGINGSGALVGESYGGRGPVFGVFGTAASGVSVDLSYPGAIFRAVNDSDQIAVDINHDTEYVISSLNDTLGSPGDPAISFPGATTFTTGILGINNAGWLVGDYVDSSNVQHAFEATVVTTPEPSYAPLIAGALLAAVFFKRRRAMRRL